MTNQNTLQQDVLDILFANRNKSYGAYLLRKTYPERLKKSLGLMLAGVMLLSGWMVWKEHHRLKAAALNAYHMTEVHVQQLPKEMPPIAHPVVAPAVQHPPVLPHIVAPPMPTTTVTPPRLVDNPTNQLPDVSSLDGQQIAAETIKGPSGNGVAPIGNGVVNAPKDGGEGESAPFISVEKMPEFPGGDEALRRFFMRYLQTPDALEAGAKVRVMIRFVVGKDGSLSAYDIQQSGGQIFDTEVVRVLKKMPKWTPGIQNGKPVAVYFSLPVTFVRSED